MYVLRNIEAHSSKHCRSGKAISITYSECAFIALGIHNEKHMRRILLSSVACLTLQYIFFPHYLTKDAIFGNTLLNVKCVP